MSAIFSFEDKHGIVVDENGGLEPMEYIVDQNKYIIESIATHSEYLKNMTSCEYLSICPILIHRKAKR